MVVGRQSPRLPNGDGCLQEINLMAHQSDQQVGRFFSAVTPGCKTTLFFRPIDALLDSGVSPSSILYATSTSAFLSSWGQTE